MGAQLRHRIAVAGTPSVTPRLPTALFDSALHILSQVKIKSFYKYQSWMRRWKPDCIGPDEPQFKELYGFHEQLQRPDRQDPPAVVPDL